MLEYKREKNTLEGQLKDIRKKARYHDDHLKAIDAWFKQLIDEVKVLAEGDDDVDMDLDILPSSLLFADQPSFEEHLAARSKDIRTIISRLFGQTKGFTPEVLSLQKRISQLLASEKQHATELERMQSERDEMEERLENAAMRYMSAEKKIDRAKSTTVAKLEKQALLGATKREPEDGTAVKKEESAMNGLTDNTEELAEMETQFNKVSANSEKQKEQLEKLQEENSKLQSQITELQTKSASLTDDDYAGTALFKQLRSQHEDVVKRLNDMEARNTQLKEENQKYISERTIHSNQLDAELRATVAEKDQQVSVAEGNLSRIRTERDDHQAKRDILQKTVDSEKTAQEKVREITASLNDQVKALQEENARLNLTNGPKLEELDGLSSDDLRTRYESLSAQYKRLTDEIESMQTACSKALKLSHQKVNGLASLEEKVQRLSAEKQKADQKYFGAMKSKEARDAEIRTLKMQTAKSSEVVNALKESEAVARLLVANLEKQLSEFREAVTTKTNDHRAVSLEKQKQDLEIGRLTGQVTELKQLLVTKDSQLGAAQSERRTAEQEVSGLQTSLKDTKRSLESWKSKSGQNEQYEVLRSIAYCNICKKSLKNTVIKTCGHTFCSDCVDERLTSRSRKCPNCGKSFGSNDHMRITL